MKFYDCPKKLLNALYISMGWNSPNNKDMEVIIYFVSISIELNMCVYCCNS
jgi:hypothetical protein